MRDLKSIIKEMSYYKRLNESDYPQVVDVLQTALDNSSLINKGENMEHKDCLSTDDCQQPETPNEKAKRLASKIISINATLESIKPLYGELDAAVLELRDLIGLNKQYIEAGTQIGVQIKDEFAEKNTIWRIQPQLRFVAKLETVDERIKRQEKEAKAAEKAAKK